MLSHNKLLNLNKMVKSEYSTEYYRVLWNITGKQKFCPNFSGKQMTRNVTFTLANSIHNCKEDGEKKLDICHIISEYVMKS